MARPVSICLCRSMFSNPGCSPANQFRYRNEQTWRLPSENSYNASAPANVWRGSILWILLTLAKTGRYLRWQGCLLFWMELTTLAWGANVVLSLKQVVPAITTQVHFGVFRWSPESPCKVRLWYQQVPDSSSLMRETKMVTIRGIPRFLRGWDNFLFPFFRIGQDCERRLPFWLENWQDGTMGWGMKLLFSVS